MVAVAAPSVCLSVCVFTHIWGRWDRAVFVRGGEGIGWAEILEYRQKEKLQAQVLSKLGTSYVK